MGTEFGRTSAVNWKFKTAHAQGNDILTPSGGLTDFISAESIVLCAGPAVYDQSVSLSSLIPIGLCDSVGVQQNTNIIQLWEVGSRLPYLIPGRTQAQLQLNRVVFNGDSLMGALTAGANSSWMSSAGSDSPGVDWNASADGGKYDNNGAFLMNLASSFFKKPFGLAILVQDGDNSKYSITENDVVRNVTNTENGQFVSGLYAENCYIQSHQMNVQGQQFIVMESALVRLTNLVPMQGLVA